MPDDFTAQFESPLDQPPDVDALVRATMSWHFSPCTGSPYWVGRARSFDFDPLTDVQTLSDIQDAFREVPLDWDQIPADQLVPTGCRTRPGRFGVYETGGTTGPPKRIVDAGSRLRNVQWHSRLLDEQDFPRAGGNWLHVGPTGPHIMAKDISNLAALREFLCYYIDFDPRWVRRCLADGRHDDSERYVTHVLDQVRDVLSTQDIHVISTTPAMLEAVVGRPDVHELMRRNVRGIIWGGTSADAATLRLLEAEVFPEATISGAYGNTLMGVAPQRRRRPEDPSACIFRPYFPYTVLEVVDPEEPTKPMGDGAEGQVMVTVLTRDLFVPPTLERDLATRHTPSGDGGIEVWGVRPGTTAHHTAIEGVY